MTMPPLEHSKRRPWHRELAMGIAVGFGSQALWAVVGLVSRLCGL